MKIWSQIFGFAAQAFKTFQTDFGTSPVADAPDDTLTFTSSNGSVVITGNSTTDTINFEVSNSFMGVDLRILAEQNVTVDTSQDELKGGSTREATRVEVWVENQSATLTVRVGLTGISSSTGDLLLPGEEKIFPIGDQGLFGITASGSATVHVKEWGP